MLDDRLRFMGYARDHLTGPVAQGAGDTMHLLFPAGDAQVRKALSTTRAALRGMGVNEDQRGVAEIVLAEALNNVVEHAYAERGPGIVEMEIWRQGDALAICIQDDGVPMPDGALPAGTHHDLSVEVQDLPEGGFGWAIIRDLTENLIYERDGSRNRLRFEIPLTGDLGHPIS